MQVAYGEATDLGFIPDISIYDIDDIIGIDLENKEDLVTDIQLDVSSMFKLNIIDNDTHGLDDDRLRLLNQEVAELEQKKIQLNLDINKSKSALEAKKSLIEDADSRLSDLKNEQRELESACNKLADSYDEGMEALNELLSEFEGKDRELTSLLDKRAELQSSIHKLSIEMAESQAKLSESQAEVSKYEAKLAESQAEVSKYEAKLAESQARLAELDADNDRLKSENNKLIDSNNVLRSEDSELKNSIASSKLEQARLDDELRRLKKSIDSSRETAMLEENNVRVIKDRAIKLDIELRQTKLEVSLLKGELEQLMKSKAAIDSRQEPKREEVNRSELRTNTASKRNTPISNLLESNISNKASLKNDIRNEQTAQTGCKDTTKYDQMDLDSLYEEVSKFLMRRNIHKKVVDIRILEKEFGANNIRKLVLKSYLISIGKGVTMGQ